MLISLRCSFMLFSFSASLPIKREKPEHGWRLPWNRRSIPLMRQATETFFAPAMKIAWIMQWKAGGNTGTVLNALSSSCKSQCPQSGLFLTQANMNCHRACIKKSDTDSVSFDSEKASFRPIRRSPRASVLDVAQLRLRWKPLCGLGLGESLPFLNRNGPAHLSGVTGYF